MFDIVLENGFVIDPRNGIMSKLNVGISGSMIASVSHQALEGKKRYDCTNLIVTPGFVDAHIHEDPYDDDKHLIQLDISKSMLKMGVTTVVGGNCGLGPKNLKHYMSEVNRLGHPVNVTMLSAHGSLRDSFGSFDKYRSIDDFTIEKMCYLLEEELVAGSIGLSFGVRYIPGMDYREMSALAKVVKKYDGIVAAHVRDDAKNVLSAIEEMVRLAQDIGVKIQISHIGSMAAFGQMEQAMELIDHHVANGINIGLDCYPYYAFCTSIGSTTYDEGFVSRYGLDYSNIEIMEGKYKGKRCTEKMFREERQNHPEYLAVAHVMKENEVDMALTHPRTLVGSDGLLHNGNGHPRAGGTFPRFLKEYVLNKKVISLYEAVNKMTNLTATRFSLDNGSLSIGSRADVTVFDLNLIEDTATFDNPISNPTGIKYVFIKGQLALCDGEILRLDLGNYMALHRYEDNAKFRF